MIHENLIKLMFPILKMKFSVAEILKNIFQKESFFSNNNMRRFFTPFQNLEQLSRKEYIPRKNKP